MEKGEVKKIYILSRKKNSIFCQLFFFGYLRKDCHMKKCTSVCFRTFKAFFIRNATMEKGRESHNACSFDAWNKKIRFFSACNRNGLDEFWAQREGGDRRTETEKRMKRETEKRMKMGDRKTETEKRMKMGDRKTETAKRMKMGDRKTETGKDEKGEGETEKRMEKGERVTGAIIIILRGKSSPY